MTPKERAEKIAEQAVREGYGPAGGTKVWIELITLGIIAAESRVASIWRQTVADMTERG